MHGNDGYVVPDGVVVGVVVGELLGVDAVVGGFVGEDGVVVGFVGEDGVVPGLVPWVGALHIVMGSVPGGGPVPLTTAASAVPRRPITRAPVAIATAAHRWCAAM
jgi:hypothetical protein